MGLLKEDGRTNPTVVAWSGREEPPPFPGPMAGSQEPATNWSSQDEVESCRKACDEVRGLVILNPRPGLCPCPGISTIFDRDQGIGSHSLDNSQ